MKKKFLLLFFSLLSFNAIHAYYYDNYDFEMSDDGTLTISGVSMENFYSNSDAPWYYYREKIKKVVIKNGMLNIGNNAFERYENLTSVTIPESVKIIGNYAFDYCTSLTSITIPKSVTSIGIRAFESCSSLTSITIPKSVTSIGLFAFGECTSLTSITVENGNTIYDSRNNCNAVIETNSSTLIVGCKNTVIPNSVKKIGRLAFGYCNLTSITIPNSVTSIDRDAFYWCKGLTSITIPNSVTSIGEYAFYGCTGLTSVTIPNSVTSIGDGAFQNCTGLTSVTISNSVTKIGKYAFKNCKSLTSVINYAKTPQKINNQTFSSYGTLHVPSGCKAAYEAADGWKNFTIVDDVTTGINVVKGTPTISSDKIFSISGQQLNNTKKGLNIINGKKILVK